jgi:hypothetical protein
VTVLRHAAAFRDQGPQIDIGRNAASEIRQPPRPSWNRPRGVPVTWPVVRFENRDQFIGNHSMGAKSDRVGPLSRSANNGVLRLRFYLSFL